MKLGFGLYRHMLDDEHLKFAKQLGATHIVVHMCDYFNKQVQFSNNDQPIGDKSGWGLARGDIWTVEELSAVKEKIESHGLCWYAIENFDPKHWDHILFGGSKRAEQIETIKHIIRNVGEIGVPVFGYNFSLTGVTGRVITNDARGGAQTVGMDGSNEILECPLPNSMAWNMVVDPAATGIRPAMTTEQLWENLALFLNEIIPVAESAGVTMAAHPDDPPLEVVRGLPKLVNQPEKYQRLLDLYPSAANALEYCLGTIAEMTNGDVYQATEHYVSLGKVPYIHLRNVTGKVPHYKEVFIDEGDIDIKRIVQILKDNKFEGVLIPDHTPQVSCPAPWHAGMAYAMGYINSLIKE
ncbi:MULTISPECIES: mannonate dehydratase [Vibrio]|uniref:mannonate dehydratase n=1 Tax=Vibrio TaxID=662 RepID=UPI0004DD1548|nr:MULTISPECIES: mannonate dehydratase [Vibrio]KFA99860.1 D-mannonate dehydratase [Vibrio sp. ER1A]MCG9660382.1 mannonate dehydratase [Vibrio mediterranei]